MSLTELSYYFRKYLPFAAFAFVTLLIFFYLMQVVFLIIANNQSNTLTIDPIFKQLKPLVLKKEATTSAGFSFTLDTIEGQPITATPTAQVFLFPPAKFQFDYLPKVYLMAKTLGFDTEVIKHKLVNNEAIFQDTTQRLAIDINTYNFRYDYDFRKDGELIDSLEISDQEVAQNTAINFLKSIDRYPQDLAQGKTNTVYMYYDKVASNAGIIESPQESNMIEIDFYRPDIAQAPAVSPSYFNSQNYVMMLPTRSGAKVVSAQVRYYDTSTTQIGIYPLMTGQRAYEKLLAGNGILVSEGSGKKNITIKKMFLGYFDPDIYQDYYQPVFVFLGDDNFVSYVPAVSEKYLIDENKL